MNPKVAVVVLNFNTQPFLARFLPTLLATDYDNMELVVVDNGSKDDSVNFLKTAFPEVKLIALNQNFGFAGGYNRALSQIDADYFVLLNSDVEVSKNWLNPLVQLAESDPKIGAIQPKILDFSNKTRFEYAGGSGGYIDKYGYPFCRGRWFNKLEEDQGQYDDVCEIFWATGACFFINAKFWREMEGLDEDFFAHMEEIDLCWRLKNSGYKNMVCPQSEVYHIGGGTLPVGNPRKTYLNFRNGLYLLCKNLHDDELVQVMLIRLLLDGLAGLKFLTEFKFREIGAILKAHYTFYKSLNYWLNKRKKSLSRERYPVGMYRGSMVFDFFVKGLNKFSQIVIK